MKSFIQEEIRNFINRHYSGNGQDVDDFDLNKIARTKAEEEINNNIEAYYKYEFCEYHEIDEDDFDDEDMINSESYLDFVTEEIYYELERAIGNIKSNFDGDEIEIARVMTVSQRWLEMLPKKRLHLGIYWSWDHSVAEAHWANTNNKIYVTINARVKVNYIDWESTLLANGDIHLGDNEREITLHKNTPIKIVGLEVDDKNIDIDELGISDKIYVA